MKKYSILFLFMILSSLCCFSQTTSKYHYQRPKKIDHEYYIEHTQYSLSFNIKTNCPNWVAWQLDASEVVGNADREKSKFLPDPMVMLSHRVTTNDYTKSGYDRGHMCPAADNKYSQSVMDESFYMTNMCPQYPDLNRKWWEHLEDACRRWAKNEGTIYIACGPVFKSNNYNYIGKNIFVAVPDGFFKVVLSLKKGEEKTIGFYYRNDGSRQTMEDAACSVDYIEQLTGFDFFYMVNNKIEEKIESTYNLKKWQ